MVICLEQDASDWYMVQLMPLPPHHLCFNKIQNGLTFWYRLTQVVLEKAIKRVLLSVAIKLLYCILTVISKMCKFCLYSSN